MTSGGLRALLLVACFAAVGRAGEQPAAVAGEEAGPEAAAGKPAEEPAQAKPAAAKADAEKALKWEVDTYVNGSLRSRFVDSDSDVDLYVDVAVDLVRRGDHPISARLNGRLHADLGGDQAPDDLLYDYWDTYDSALQGRLYELFAKFERLFDAPLAVTAGRQFVDEGTYLHFDGGRLDIDLDKSVKGLSGYLLGGVPVRFGDGSRSGDWLAGLVAHWRIDNRTRLRLEYYHVSDDTGDDTIDDDLIGLSAWHRLQKTIQLFGRFNLLDGDANELQLRGKWDSEDGLWTVVVDAYFLFERLFEVTNDLTPYVPMLGSYEPFWRLGANATRRIGEEWVLQGGLNVRRLIDQNDEGTFNHNFVHYFANVSRLDLLDRKLDVTASLIGYSSSEDDTLAIGCHLDYRLTGEITLSGGIDYSLFKYDFFANDEHEDVWSYSIRARWKATKKVTARIDLVVDDDDFDTWTTVVIGATVRF